MKPSYEIYKVRDPNMKGHIILAVDDPHSYQDILDMPDPINASFGIRIFNYTGATLYFTAQGSGSENAGAKWIWGAAQQLGGIGSGANAYFALMNLGSRVKPASAVDDNIIITVRAYTDSGYTNEVGAGYQILITYHWIKSDTLTLLDLDNFDGGTLEDWSMVGETPQEALYPRWVIDTAYVLSSPNSALLDMYYQTPSVPHTMSARIEKAFVIPACANAYFIANCKWRGRIRSNNQAGIYSVKWPMFQIFYNSTDLSVIRDSLAYGSFFLDYYTMSSYVSTNWYRMLAKLPTNQSITIKIRIQYTGTGPADTYVRWLQCQAWFDDLKVVYEP